MISFAHFTKQSCTITDILITPESQYSYRKTITRGHMMYVFKIDKVPFTGLHCTPERYPRLMSESRHKERIGRKEKKDIYIDSGGRNIFLKVTLGCSKILRVISAVVASLMNKWGTLRLVV